MSLESFRQLWFSANSITIWCEKYKHPLHRICPVVLTYDSLPPPFAELAKEPHQGTSGETVQLTPERCYHCEMNVLNGGVCDPV